MFIQGRCGREQRTTETSSGVGGQFLVYISFLVVIIAPRRQAHVVANAIDTSTMV